MRSLISVNSAHAQQYRHEFKYICDEMQLAIIQARIQPLLRLDSHVGQQGFYQIRSLYFDDPYDSCYLENENGTDPREKFRIRIYDADASRISLELKRKEKGKTLKLSCLLTQEQCRALMRGEILPEGPAYPQVLQKLLTLMKTKHYQPKVIVEYTRVPYVYPIGNVRVTLDKSISSSAEISGFLNPEIPLRPILETGKHVLEVKYDELLPDYIYNLLQLPLLRQTAFSKYYLCRKYSL